MSPSQTTITRRGWDFHALRGSIDSGDLSLLPRVVRVVEVWKEFSSGDEALSFLCAAGPRRWPEGQLSPRAGSMSLIQSATSQWGWGFHTQRSGIDPGDLRFRSRVVVVVGCGRTCDPGMRTYLREAGSRRWSEGQLSPRSGSMSPSQSAITKWGWGLHSMRGDIDPLDLRFRPRVIGVEDVWMDF